MPYTLPILTKKLLIYGRYPILTHKQLETHGCILRAVATDALVLKHQAISIHGAD